MCCIPESRISRHSHPVRPGRPLFPRGPRTEHIQISTHRRTDVTYRRFLHRSNPFHRSLLYLREYLKWWAYTHGTEWTWLIREILPAEPDGPGGPERPKQRKTYFSWKELTWSSFTISTTVTLFSISSFSHGTRTTHRTMVTSFTFETFAT